MKYFEFLKEHELFYTDRIMVQYKQHVFAFRNKNMYLNLYIPFDESGILEWYVGYIKEGKTLYDYEKTDPMFLPESFQELISRSEKVLGKRDKIRRVFVKKD